MDNAALRQPSFWIAIALLVSFFLPWLSLIIVSLSGFDLAAAPLSALGQAMGGEVYLALILWLVPIFAIIALLGIVRGRSSGRSGILVASIVVVLTVVVLLLAGTQMGAEESTPPDMQMGPIDMIGIGLWIALVASIAGILTVLGVIKGPTAARAG